MTAPACRTPDTKTFMPTQTDIDETPLEHAILDLLATRREIYPTHIIGELQRRHPSLPLERTCDVMERLFTERRVARLWHRYILACHVEAVRAKWLATIDRQANRIDADPLARAMFHDARDFVMRWDGWHLPHQDARP